MMMRHTRQLLRTILPHTQTKQSDDDDNDGDEDDDDDVLPHTQTKQYDVKTHSAIVLRSPDTHNIA